jgi:hypothetical protein
VSDELTAAHDPSPPKKAIYVKLTLGIVAALIALIGGIVSSAVFLKNLHGSQQEILARLPRMEQLSQDRYEANRHTLDSIQNALRWQDYYLGRMRRKLGIDED